MISEEGYSPETIALGFAADRMVHNQEIILDKLNSGETVVCDRYYHSSLTYQAALGADTNWIKEINKYAVTPDLTIILDVSAETGMERLNDRGKDDNIFEELSFQEEVVKRYQELEEKLEENITYVDGSKTIEIVEKQVEEVVRENLGL